MSYRSNLNQKLVMVLTSYINYSVIECQLIEIGTDFMELDEGR